jgi:hypothetical protein
MRPFEFIHRRGTFLHDSSFETLNVEHQDLRTEGGVLYGDTMPNMDFAYLAKVTATNALAAASMASAAIIRHSTHWGCLRCASSRMPRTIGLKYVIN